MQVEGMMPKWLQFEIDKVSNNKLFVKSFLVSKILDFCCACDKFCLGLGIMCCLSSKNRVAGESRSGIITSEIMGGL
jgi:hypothetical protein